MRGIEVLKSTPEMSGLFVTEEADKLGLPPLRGCGIQRRQPDRTFQVRFPDMVGVFTYMIFQGVPPLNHSVMLPVRLLSDTCETKLHF